MKAMRTSFVLLVLMLVSCGRRAHCAAAEGLYADRNTDSNTSTRKAVPYFLMNRSAR